MRRFDSACAAKSWLDSAKLEGDVIEYGGAREGEPALIVTAPFPPVALPDVPATTFPKPRAAEVPVSALRHASQEQVYPERVSHYLGKIAAGKRMPAVDVIKVGDTYAIWDGNHRATAAWMAGAKTLKVRVVGEE